MKESSGNFYQGTWTIFVLEVPGQFTMLWISFHLYNHVFLSFTVPAKPVVCADGVHSFLLVSLGSHRPAPTDCKQTAVHYAVLWAYPNWGGPIPQWWGSCGCIIAWKSQDEALDFEGYILEGVQPSFVNFHCSPWGTQWTKVTYIRSVLFPNKSKHFKHAFHLL